jgi:hypothetical protein
MFCNRVDGKLKSAFVRVVKVIAMNQVAFNSFIIRAEVFNMFQIAMEVGHVAAFFSDEAPDALPSKTKRRVFYILPQA